MEFTEFTLRMEFKQLKDKIQFTEKILPKELTESTLEIDDTQMKENIDNILRILNSDRKLMMLKILA